MVVIGAVAIAAVAPSSDAGAIEAAHASDHARHRVERAARIYFGGRIETLDAHMNRADALAIADGRILAVGGYGDVFRHFGPGTRLVDLHDHALLPGFVDAHDHWFNDHAELGLTLDDAQHDVIANGITALGDLFVNPPILNEIQSFADSGALRVRTSLYLIYDNTCGSSPFGAWFLGVEPNHDPEALLRIPGVKIFADPGVPNTCGLAPDVSDAPAVSFTYTGVDPALFGSGTLFFDQSDLDDVVQLASDAGFQVAIHAIGDRARDQAITAIAHALDGAPNLLRHRIEHNSFVRPDQIEMFSVIGIVPTAWIFNTCSIDAHLGSVASAPDSAHAWVYPWRTMLADGLPLAWHSDYPFRDANPLVHLFGLVTREAIASDGSICEPPDDLASEAVTVDQALRMMTSGSAYALGMDGVIGSLEPGKLADLVVLSNDPRVVDHADIPAIEVLSTVIGGEPLYCASSHSALCL